MRRPGGHFQVQVCDPFPSSATRRARPRTARRRAREDDARNERRRSDARAGRAPKKASGYRRDGNGSVNRRATTSRRRGRRARTRGRREVHDIAASVDTEMVALTAVGRGSDGGHRGTALPAAPGATASTNDVCADGTRASPSAAWRLRLVDLGAVASAPVWDLRLGPVVAVSEDSGAALGPSSEDVLTPVFERFTR
jgi:hypothetical protein